MDETQRDAIVEAYIMQRGAMDKEEFILGIRVYRLLERIRTMTPRQLIGYIAAIFLSGVAFATVVFVSLFRRQDLVYGLIAAGLILGLVGVILYRSTTWISRK